MRASAEGGTGGGGARWHPRLTQTRAKPSPPPARPPAQFRTYKIIYRRYAGLFFAFCVDVNDNELGYLESIHVFVEMLDRYFGNVCELDLVFNFHKVRALGGGRARTAPSAAVATARARMAPPRCFLPHRPPPRPPRASQVYAILDEFIVAGELQETSQLVMLDRVKELEKMMM